MKKIYFILFVLPMFASAQIINFPDANFKAQLVASNVNGVPGTMGYQSAKNFAGDFVAIDSNNDGEIQQSEALEIYWLFVGGTLADLTGLEYFQNLIGFSCNGSTITYIDLSPLTNLVSMGISDTSVTAINLQGLQQLKDVYCIENPQLTTLDVSGLVSLEDINCEYNQLTSMTFGNNPLLLSIGCSNNQITTLDLRNLPSLKSFFGANNLLTSLLLDGLQNLFVFQVEYNYLTSINLNNLPVLMEINCSHNQLTSLDFTNNPMFQYLTCEYNNLTTIKIKNGIQQQNYYLGSSWGHNPFLNYICADDFDIPGLQTFLYACQITQPVTIDSNCNLDTTVFEENANVVVAPNPTNDMVTLNFGQYQEVVTVTLLNVLGQEISSKTYNQVTATTYTIIGDKGLYFLVIENLYGEKKIIKVMKE